MQKRRFGRTELQMPVFSTGGMRYQYQWQDKPLNEIPAENQLNLEATIERSLAAGINHIETARGYGSSERQLGVILPRYDRDTLIVQTKIGPEKDSELFRKNFMESLERLQLDYVDLLAIHGINNEETLEMAIRPGGNLEVCRELQRLGLARHIGFSTHGSCAIIEKTIRSEAHGGFDYVNLHWYYIYQRNWPAVLAARERDMGVFIISPTDKGGMLHNPPARLMELTAPLHPIVFNDLFCLNQPEVHTLSIGASKPSDYDLHLEAERLYPQRQQLIAPILQRLQQALEETVGREFAHDYLKGVRDWEQNPGEVNIGIILWLLNLKDAFGMEEYARMRYNLLGNGGHWFPGKNVESAPLQELANAVAGSPFREVIVQRLERAHRELYTAPVKRLSQS